VAGLASLSDSIQGSLRKLAPDAHRVLVGISGGSDSVALLLALDAAPDLEVVAGHLDHGMRTDSGEDAAWVRQLCKARGITLEMERIDLPRIVADQGGNTEEVGRTLRYAFLARAAKATGCDHVVTAHTRNDQAETVLMQLLRGSAYAKGIDPVRGSIVRPLLEWSREDLRGWLDAQGQGWREDQSNRDIARDRAWLRHEVLPRLERRRPGTLVRLAQYGHLQRDQAAFLADEAQRRFGTDAISRSALERAPRAVQREALTQRIRSEGGDVTSLHLEALLDVLDEGGVTRQDLPGGVRVRVLRDEVDARIHGETRGVEQVPTLVTEPAHLPEGAPPTILTRGPAVLRTPQAGDRIRLSAGRRLVMDVLAEAGVAREERPSWQVLAQDDEVVWIEGIAAAEGIDLDDGDEDRRFMRAALALAERAGDAGEVPIGAVVVRNGEIIGQGANAREATQDPSAHAEIVAMREAASREQDWRLAGATLYVTVEPCPMCAGAILESHLERVVWGAANTRDGALGTIVDLTAGAFKRLPQRRSGVLSREAQAVLQGTFRARRQTRAD